MGTITALRKCLISGMRRTTNSSKCARRTAISTFSGIVSPALRMSGLWNLSGRQAEMLEASVIESSVPRQVFASLLIVAFGLANLPPLTSWTARRQRSCCSLASCCRNHQCAMNGQHAAIPTSRMPMTNCSMRPRGKTSPLHGRSISCSCSISRSASIFALTVQSYLFFEPYEHGKISPAAITVWVSFPAGPSTLPGFPQSADHPPKLRS